MVDERRGLQRLKTRACAGLTALTRNTKAFENRPPRTVLKKDGKGHPIGIATNIAFKLARVSRRRDSRLPCFSRVLADGSSVVQHPRMREAEAKLEASEDVVEEVAAIATSLAFAQAIAAPKAVSRLCFSVEQTLAELQSRCQAKRQADQADGSLKASDFLQLSWEQKDAVEYPHSLFLQGRSGTGKTLVLVQRILLRSSVFLRIEQSGHEPFERESLTRMIENTVS